MCLFGQSTPHDNSAEIARQQEEERQAKINAGKTKIDEAFNVFDPAYYDKFQKAYTDNYNPQVDKQFTDARQGVRYNLARKGTLDATAGQKAFGDLVDSYDEKRRQVASNALEATNKIRTAVEQNKSDLYNQNTASADPNLSAISAVGRAGSLSSPQAYSPLGDLFSGLVNSTGSYLAGRNQALPVGYARLLSPGGTVPTGSGSGYLVNG